ncbi:MAG: hypothetical protein ACK52J_05085 [bacterium]|jgi:hypothetical protein
MPYLLKTIELSDEGLVRNTVFCFGVMYDKSPMVFKINKDYGNIF